jgi:hypothetical protein
VAEISDELLMAYADDALDPAARAAVEVALEKHPEYRVKVEKFRSTGGPIRAAFQEELETTHLGTIIGRIRRDNLALVGPEARSNALRVVGISGVEARTHEDRFRRRLPMAMAASVALLIGTTLGWWLHTSPMPSSQLAPLVRFGKGEMLAQGALRELLEGVRSDTPITARTDDGEVWTLNATLTFRTAKHLPCRRYEVAREAIGRFAGYACRNEEGQWSIHAHTHVAAKVPNGNGFAPSARKDGDPAFEAALRAAMDGDVYETAEEAELIARRWTSQ